jgi:hypothetical protein
MVVLLNLRLKCSRFAPKPAHSSSKLPLFPLNDTTIYRMVMEETRWGAVSPGVFLVDSYLSRRFPLFHLKRHAPQAHRSE